MGEKAEVWGGGEGKSGGGWESEGDDRGVGEGEGKYGGGWEREGDDRGVRRVREKVVGVGRAREMTEGWGV